MVARRTRRRIKGGPVVPGVVNMPQAGVISDLAVPHGISIVSVYPTLPPSCRLIEVQVSLSEPRSVAIEEGRPVSIELGLRTRSKVRRTCSEGF